MAATAERHDLNGDVRQRGYLDEPVQLLAHHRAPAHRPPQRRLVHDRPHDRRLRPGEQVLALEPHAHPAVDLVRRCGLVAQQGDGAGVSLGLEQAMHELHLEGADHRGGPFQAQVRLEPVGQDVAVLRPPARDVGLPGKRQHPSAHLLIGHAVQGEQVGHVPLLKPHPAVFHPADLGPGGPDLIPSLVVRDACCLTQTVQLVS